MLLTLLADIADGHYAACSDERRVGRRMFIHYFYRLSAFQTVSFEGEYCIVRVLHANEARWAFASRNNKVAAEIVKAAAMQAVPRSILVAPLSREVYAAQVVLTEIRASNITPDTFALFSLSSSAFRPPQGPPPSRFRLPLGRAVALLLFRLAAAPSWLSLPSICSLPAIWQRFIRFPLPFCNGLP